VSDFPKWLISLSKHVHYFPALREVIMESDSDPATYPELSKVFDLVSSRLAEANIRFWKS
jgi:hypothetical protein